ncbi:MAG: protein kinase domain-containing protein [Acidobacteriota bacterium]
MQLTPGSEIGTLRIVSALGAGGMGEVYLAQDTRLGREVALKILPTALAHDPERRSRFEREARVLASLNHPNIATLHGLREFSGRAVLEMEFVPGDTMAERLERGPMPVDEALPVFRQIAQALEAAHERGVVHRDLKPANIKILGDGRVKVLDFGLAKALDVDPSRTDRRDHAHLDVTSSQSQPGMILGTARYMSPEQARGQQVDRRSDIWSFGCVLYEALAGRPPFVAATATDTLAAILREEPDWPALIGPPHLQRLVRRCLRKDLQARLRDIADARLEIDEMLQESAFLRPISGPLVSHSSRLRAIGVAIGMTLLVLAVVWLWRFLPPSGGAPSPPTRVAVTLPPGQAFVVGPSPVLALSADGRRLVYVAAGAGSPARLFLRPLESFEATPIAHTEGASAPFFSPDGQWVGFYARDAIRKVAFDGAPPIKITDAPTLASATWMHDGHILFATTLADDGLWRVSAEGGQAERLTTPDTSAQEVHHAYPHAISDARVVFSVLTDDGVVGAVLSMADRKWRRLPQLRPGAGGLQLIANHLVMAQGGGLIAIPFDADKSEVAGSPVPIGERVAVTADEGATFAASQGGTLVYVPGRTAVPRHSLVLVDRDGRAAPLNDVHAAYAQPRFSPDGRSLAFTIETETGADVWLQDLQRGTRVRLTTGDAADTPVWSPDGVRVGFHVARATPWSLYARVADGSRPAEPVLTRARPEAAAAWTRDPAEALLPGFLPALTGANPQYPMAWTPDGQALAFVERKPNGERDIWIAAQGLDPTPFLLTPADESSPDFAPNGRWLAYVSDESGRNEVYVQPYPEPGGRWLISTNGGTDPMWSRDGRVLYYLEDDRLMAVPIQTGTTLTAGTPGRLFEGRYVRVGIGRNYDLAPDGSRFLMVLSETPDSTPRVHVLLNWTAEVRSSPR